jgi:hypothetical protein
MAFASVFFFGPNNVPSPIAIKATNVATTIISAIATYSIIQTPHIGSFFRENAQKGRYLCFFARSA